MTTKTKTNKKTRITVIHAEDLFRLAKRLEKKGQLITKFSIMDDVNITANPYLDYKSGCMLGRLNYIDEISTVENLEGKQVERTYLVGYSNADSTLEELKLKEERIIYNS